MTFSKEVCEAPTRSGVTMGIANLKVYFGETISVRSPASLVLKAMADATQRHPLSERGEKVSFENDQDGGAKKISVKVFPDLDNEYEYNAAQYRAREIVSDIMEAFAYENGASMAMKSTGADKSEAMPSKAVEAAKMKVLVVDENTKLLSFLDSFLSKKGYQPILVPSGAGALKQIKTQQPDIAIIGDFKPMGSSNLNLLRKLRVSSNLPVIILSTCGEDSYKIEGIVSGADDYMSKPFNPVELVLRINAVLRRSGSGLREESVKAKLDS